MLTWSGCTGGAALVGAVLLLGGVGRDEARPTPGAAAVPSATAAPAVSATIAATPTDDSLKLDKPPRAVVPEERLRQQEAGNRLVIDTKGKWTPECAIHRPCKVAPRALEVCPRDAEAWGATLARRAELAGLGCAGDESRLCCAWSARGEEVIASGRLSYQTGRLLLSSPELCRTKAD